ncbi:DUF348 domain-containing protein [Streptomyces sp. SB3404]|uniref:DUF348 domain-containing protein n=1 Tax=Streptomyces boncukensis TaxID=2711219 RepID=A0A6G4WV07_9ACTN|nr:resuscitation-promoting factor [Streptomyces boncukensis]NGO68301.1 DUF348 domain-containing protein [Streptomyces boncukensis]
MPPSRYEAYGEAYERDAGHAPYDGPYGAEGPCGPDGPYQDPAGYDGHDAYDRYDGGPESGARVPAARQEPAPAEGGRAAARRAARSRRSAERPEVFRKLLPQALVVAFLAGGTSAFVAYDKSVTLDVDGNERTLRTFAGDVEELLDDEGVELGRHDAVTPAPGERLADGDEVDIRYGRPLRLTLDGEQRRAWTTARTVGSALRDLGVRAEGARISAPRSAPIGRQGRALEVWTERSVTFLADRREHTVRTNASTVGEALREAGLTLRGSDTASVPLGSVPRDGQTVSVLRIDHGKKVREQRIPYETVRREDPELLKGTEVVAQQGRPGLRRITYRVRVVNGVKQKPKRTGDEVVREPRTEVIKVGTKERPKPKPAAGGGGGEGGGDGLDWNALAQCESGGRANAVDPSGTYGGLYQFDTQTWRGLGGSGRPQDASAAEQTQRARKLYVSRGASPWPVCGRKLSR